MDELEKIKRIYDNNERKIGILNKEISKLKYYTSESKILIATIIALFTVLFTSLGSNYLLSRLGLNISLFMYQLVPVLISSTLGIILGKIYTDKQIKKNSDIYTYIPNTKEGIQEEIIKKEIERDKLTYYNEINKRVIENSKFSTNTTTCNRNAYIRVINILTIKLEKELKRIEDYTEKVVKNYYLGDIDSKMDVFNNSILSSVSCFGTLFMASNISTLLLTINKSLSISFVDLIKVPLLGSLISIPIGYKIFKTRYNNRKKLGDTYSSIRSLKGLYDSIDRSVKLEKDICFLNSKLNTKEVDTRCQYKYDRSVSCTKKIEDPNINKGRTRSLKRLYKNSESR